MEELAVVVMEYQTLTVVSLFIATAGVIYIGYRTFVTSRRESKATSPDLLELLLQEGPQDSYHLRKKESRIQRKMHSHYYGHF